MSNHLSPTLSSLLLMADKNSKEYQEGWKDAIFYMASNFILKNKNSNSPLELKINFSLKK